MTYQCVNCGKYLDEHDRAISQTIKNTPKGVYVCCDCGAATTIQPEPFHQFNTDATRGATKQYGHPRFYELLEQMAELHSCKNHDYAGDKDPLKNLRACERLDLEPFMGVLVRLQDKWSRLEEFVKSKQLLVKGESVIDTLMDNAVYSLLAIILYEEQCKTD